MLFRHRIVNGLRRLWCRHQMWVRVLILRARGIEVGQNCQIEAQVSIEPGYRQQQPGSIQLGNGSRISNGVILDAFGGSIHLAQDVFIGPHCMIYGHGGVTIGADVLIAGHCCIVAGNHAIPPPNTRIRWSPDIVAPIQIGDDVWLGAGCIVLAGVSIGQGAVIAAGAVVTRDIPPYAVAMGTPARVVRYRTESDRAAT